jgi:hypothetical protein
MHFMVHSTKQKQGNRALNQSSHNFISLTTSLKEYSQTSKHSLLSGVQSDHRTLLGGVQSDHMNQGISEEGREDHRTLPCSAEGVEPREQQQQGSSSSRRKGRGWWRRTGGAGGEADKGINRGWHKHVIQRWRSSNRERLQP